MNHGCQHGLVAFRSAKAPLFRRAKGDFCAWCLWEVAEKTEVR